MGEIAGIIIPLLVFFLLIGYGFWSRRYINRKVIPAGKTKEFAILQRSIRTLLWLVILVVVIVIALVKWSTFPKENRPLVIFTIVLVTGVTAYNAIRLYYARRVR